MAVLSQTMLLADFKFGGMVHIRTAHKNKDLAVEKLTAKPPNLIPHQIFHLYSIINDSYMKDYPS